MYFLVKNSAWMHWFKSLASENNFQLHIKVEDVENMFWVLLSGYDNLKSALNVQK